VGGEGVAGLIQGVLRFLQFPKPLAVLGLEVGRLLKTLFGPPIPVSGEVARGLLVGLGEVDHGLRRGGLVGNASRTAGTGEQSRSHVGAAVGPGGWTRRRGSAGRE